MNVLLHQPWQQDGASQCSDGLSSFVRDLIISQNTKTASCNSSEALFVKWLNLTCCYWKCISKLHSQMSRTAFPALFRHGYGPNRQSRKQTLTEGKQRRLGMQAHKWRLVDADGFTDWLGGDLTGKATKLICVLLNNNTREIRATQWETLLFRPSQDT